MSTLTGPLHTRQPAVLAGAVVAGVAGAIGLYFVNPNTTHVPLCPLHSLTGLNCPLCGGTRAAYALLHGQFGTALHDNAFAVIGIPLLLLYWLHARRTGAPAVPRWLFWTVVATGLIFGVLRNLPIATALAPPA